MIIDIFYGGNWDDKKTVETIKETFEKYGYLIDTHTAVAKAVYDEYLYKTNDNKPVVIASTASPYKFLNSVISAIDPNYDVLKNDFDKLEDLSSKTNTKIPASLQALKDKGIRFDGFCSKDEMKDTVMKNLGM